MWKDWSKINGYDVGIELNMPIPLWDAMQTNILLKYQLFSFKF